MTDNQIQNSFDRTIPPKPGKPKDVHFPEYSDTVLQNGMNVLVIENHKTPLVSIRLVFKNAGSYFDGKKPGLASLTSELLTKGSKNRSAEKIADEIDFLGANLATGSDWDCTYISLTVLKKHIGKAIEILSDVVSNPVFQNEEIQRVREQRIAALIQSKDEPAILSDRMFNKIIFENHPYGNQLEGTEQSIQDITREDLIQFYKNYYRSDNLIIAFVGSITHEEALNFTNDYFNSFSLIKTESEYIRRKIINIIYKPNSVYLVNKPQAVQSSLRIGHIGLERNNPDFLTVTVMNTILGGYFSSRINHILRENKGYTYGAISSFSPRMYSGEFSIITDVRNEVTDDAVRLIIEELIKITSEEVSDEELATVKSYLTGSFPLHLETANQVATRVINLKLYDLPKDYYDTYISNINKLTKENLLSTAKRYIRPDELFIVLSGNADVIKDKMKTFGYVHVFDTDGNSIS